MLCETLTQYPLLPPSPAATIHKTAARCESAKGRERLLRKARQVLPLIAIDIYSIKLAHLVYLALLTMTIYQLSDDGNWINLPKGIPA